MNVPSTGEGAQAMLAQAVALLREQSHLARQDERAAAEQGLEAVEQRAEHAADKAEAMRGSALLRFGMALAESTVSLTSSALSIGASAIPESSNPLAGTKDGLEAWAHGTDRASGILRQADQLVAATDEAFGFGEQERAADAAMERDSLRQERAEFVEGNHRARREELEDALATVRQAVRDMANSNQGGV